MLKLASLLAALALVACAPTIPPASAPTPLPTAAQPPLGSYPRDHCGEAITPTRPAVPDAVPCP